ncbi:hypothetical protein HYT24_03240 [Candidatus Pacearchaeota archaeon]|nr:hypothetical protein [Candidatus Pacearchaeota archaeon]
MGNIYPLIHPLGRVSLDLNTLSERELDVVKRVNNLVKRSFGVGYDARFVSGYDYRLSHNCDNFERDFNGIWLFEDPNSDLGYIALNKPSASPHISDSLGRFLSQDGSDLEIYKRGIFNKWLRAAERYSKFYQEEFGTIPQIKHVLSRSDNDWHQSNLTSNSGIRLPGLFKK